MIENYDDKYLQSFEYETTAISDGSIIGTCELGKASIQMINDSNEYSSLKGQWIKTIHGSFYIYDVEPVQEKINIKLSCYDVKYKLDNDYDSSLYTWPMTLKEWRNQIGDNCRITFDNSDFPNSDLVLDAEPYVGNSPSNRDVIKLIAQAGCSWVDTDSDDVFYFNWFSEITHTINDWLELTTEKEQTAPINVIVLGRGDTEDNVYYPEELPDSPIEFRIDNNYILDPQDDTEDRRYNVIEPIYNRVNGFSYLVFNARTQQINNKLDIKLGQKVSYIDIWGNALYAYIMSKKITWLGGDPTETENYEITLSAEEINETSTEYSYGSSVESKLLKVERKADKQNGQIEDLVSSVSTISSDINNNYTSNEELEQILQNQKNTITTEMTTQYQQDMDSFSFDIINKINQDGVTSLKNTMVTIDENGINTAKNNEDVVSLLDNQGVYVSDGKKQEDNSNVIMMVDRNGGYFKTLETKSTIKEQDLIQKEKIDDETYGECQGWYWIGSDI